MNSGPRSKFVSRAIVACNKFGPRRDKRGRLVCVCGGYHFPHRKGGGACEHSKTCAIHLALRSKDDAALLDARLDFALKYPGKADNLPCPF